MVNPAKAARGVAKKKASKKKPVKSIQQLVRSDAKKAASASGLGTPKTAKNGEVPSTSTTKIAEKKAPPKRKPPMKRRAPSDDSDWESDSEWSDGGILYPQEDRPLTCKIITATRTPEDMEPDFLEKETSTERAQAAFEWMISPVTADDFDEIYFETDPFVVKSKGMNQFSSLLSTEEIDKILHDNFVYFGKNIDLTTYVDGERQTHNQEGRAMPAIVWDAYNEGCSIRMLNPQTYSKKVFELCSVMAEHFSSFVGANVYLTPPNSQGFAPHWDDIDAFVIQLEGKKRWRLYDYLDADQRLPLESSKNLTPEEVGKHFFEYELKAGDLLYLPRGLVHEARCGNSNHSLHITISVNQRKSFGDFMKVYLPVALEKAIASDIEFRKCIPRDFMSRCGAHEPYSQDNPFETHKWKIEELMKRMFNHALGKVQDNAFDLMAVNYFKDALPPVVSKAEEPHSSQTTSRWVKGKPTSLAITSRTSIRLVGKHVCRTVEDPESKTLRLYYTTDNTKVYRENEEPFMPLEGREAGSIHALMSRYPEWTQVSELYIGGSGDGEDDDKIDLASILYMKGLILAKNP